MRNFLLAVLLTCSTYPATACDDHLLTFSSWSIKAISADTNKITTVFKSHADKPIRMIDASAGYKDALGGVIGSFSLDRDVKIEPNDSYSETKTWGPFTFERLLKLKHDEVTTFVCVKAVLYDDGTKQEFN
jgi:hypothetical protein